MSKIKYVYCQYDLNHNLIEKYYLNDIITNFSKRFADVLRAKALNKEYVNNNYIWCKKLISDI